MTGHWNFFIVLYSAEFYTDSLRIILFSFYVVKWLFVWSFIFHLYNMVLQNTVLYFLVLHFPVAQFPSFDQSLSCIFSQTKSMNHQQWTSSLQIHNECLRRQISKYDSKLILTTHLVILRLQSNVSESVYNTDIFWDQIRRIIQL